MGLRKLRRACVPFVSAFLVSCGGKLAVPPASLTSPYAALEGNWHLTGQSSSWTKAAPEPYLGAVLKSVGNTIYARLTLAAQCSGSFSASFSSAIFATGNIAPDGSFILSNRSPSSSGSFSLVSPLQVTVIGMAPAKDSLSWQGNYQIDMSSAASTCSYTGNGSFTATPYPSFEGTYTGEIQQSSLGNSVSITLQVSELPPTLTFLGPAQIPEVTIPLKAAVAVSGSPCFTSGSNTTVSGGGLYGDQFSTLFVMDDGSTLAINGWFADQTEAALQPVMLIVKGGKCADAFVSATLTRQP